MKFTRMLLATVISASLVTASNADTGTIRLGRDVMPTVSQIGHQRPSAPAIAYRDASRHSRLSARYEYRPQPDSKPSLVGQAARSIARSAINTAAYEIRREVVGSVRRSVRRLSF